MTDEKTIEKLELNKILAEAASFAVLEESKRMLPETRPTAELAEAERMLSLTAEADAALFLHGAGRVEAFPSLADEPERAQKGAALSCGELLAVCGNYTYFLISDFAVDLLSFLADKKHL